MIKVFVFDIVFELLIVVEFVWQVRGFVYVVSFIEVVYVIEFGIEIWEVYFRQLVFSFFNDLL